MGKKDLINAISAINKSASREFLAEFSMRELADYRRQLESLGMTASDFATPEPAEDLFEDDRISDPPIAGAPTAYIC
jgi:hypothetical protein